MLRQRTEEEEEGEMGFTWAGNEWNINGLGWVLMIEKGPKKLCSVLLMGPVRNQKEILY